MFDVEQIRASTFVRHIEIHETLGSTNDRAAELARVSTLEMPALVVARLQTAGKGRGRNRWWSADGALTFSLLVDQATIHVQPASWPRLSLATAVAVCDALSVELESAANPQSEIRIPKAPLHLGVKWPNDVILNGRKVCGILIESPGGAAPAKDRLIIGIGINVNNSWQNAPHDAGANGTALSDVTGRQHDLTVLLVHILTAIASRTAQLRNHDIDLVREWQRRDLLAGKSASVQSNGRHIEGKCAEISYDGALVVDGPFGRNRLYGGTVRVM